MRKIVGFYGGTFDPIHFGHINLAIQLLEIHHLDEVLFCPAYCSPFKTQAMPSASPEHRLEMLRLALFGIPHFRITTYEIERNDPSFTIDTLRKVQEERRETQFRLLLSEEVASHLEEWKDFEELIRIAPPLIGARSASSRGKSNDSLCLSLTPTKVFDISSTEIRDRLKQGYYCGHLVPAKVLDYIKANGLYTL